IPAHVSAAIERAMALENSERFATVEDFWTALQIDQLDTFPAQAIVPAAAVQAVPGRTTEPSRAPAVGRPSLRSRGRWAIILLLLLLALGVGFASALLLFPGLHGPQTHSSTATPASQTATHTVATPSHTATPRPTATPSPQLTQAPAPTAT